MISYPISGINHLTARRSVPTESAGDKTSLYDYTYLIIHTV